ncbi:hypothetical protein AUP68_10507 [Ilyonectria robusta]
MTDLCSSALPREPLSSAASAAAWNTTGPRRFVSLGEAIRHKPLGQNGTELAWRPWRGPIASPTKQRAGRLGFFSCEGFPQGCTALVAATGDLRGHRLPALGCGKLFDLSVQENSRLGRDLFPLTGCPLERTRL